MHSQLHLDQTASLAGHWLSLLCLSESTIGMKLAHLCVQGVLWIAHIEIALVEVCCGCRVSCIVEDDNRPTRVGLQYFPADVPCLYEGWRLVGQLLVICLQQERVNHEWCREAQVDSVVCQEIRLSINMKVTIHSGCLPLQPAWGCKGSRG